MTESTRSETLLTEISAKLDRILALMAIQGVEEADKVERLSNMGLDQRMIASVTGLRPNTVAVRLFRMRKSRSKRSP
jgi:hypothetical protein